MGRLFWICMALLGAALVALLAMGDQGTILGIQPWQLGALAVNVVLVLFVFGGAFGRGSSVSGSIKSLAIWALIIMTLMSGYIFRYDLQDFGSRLSGGLLPGSPINRQGDDGRSTVTLVRSDNGHFEADVMLNGKRIRFLVDTGASNIVLNARDAEAIGIDVNRLAYTQPTMTANGIAYSAQARVDVLDLGAIRRRNIPVSIAEPGRLSTNLLGQTFLESLSSYERRGDRLTLRD